MEVATLLIHGRDLLSNDFLTATWADILLERPDDPLLTAQGNLSRP